MASGRYKPTTSNDLVARLNLPNRQNAAHDPLEVYHGALCGLLAMAPDNAKPPAGFPSIANWA